MANYIKNRLVIAGTPEKVKEVFEKYNTYYPAELYTAHDGRIVCKEIESEKFSVGWFDLKNAEFETRENGIVNGLPDGWKLEIKAAVNHFPDFNKVLPQPENIFNSNLGREEEEMCKKEGRPTWYEWNRQNWGTKWNSSECVEEKYNSFTFVTAWNGVPNLILELSKQNEGIEILYEYADEDTGHNCASYKFLNGEVIEENEPQGGSKEAYDLAFKLRPHYAKNYKLVGETYEYVEEES